MSFRLMSKTIEMIFALQFFLSVLINKALWSVSKSYEFNNTEQKSYS